ILFLTGDDAVDPRLGLRDELFVVENVGERSEAFEPIGKLLPTVRAPAARIEPRARLGIEETADLREMAVKAVSLHLEHREEPTPGAHRADRQTNERALEKRLATRRIEGRARVRRWRANRRDTLVPKLLLREKIAGREDEKRQQTEF